MSEPVLPKSLVKDYYWCFRDRAGVANHTIIPRPTPLYEFILQVNNAFYGAAQHSDYLKKNWVKIVIYIE